MYLRAETGTDYIDMRSDTVTRPSEGMREAMASAPLGDDVFRDDPTVLELEEAVADFLGKEAALFVPSGTMANQIAIRVHTRHGDEVIAHAGAHLYNYESGAQAALAGIAIRPLDSPDGSLPLAGVEENLHLSDDPHDAPTALICFENTHNKCGGRLVPADNISAVGALARKHGLPMHLDGARIGNASVAAKLPAASLTQDFDTVSMCFSKGLGAPCGSVLAGSGAHMALAIRYRKMYGGAMRQAGVLAAGALYALRHQLGDLVLDHERARMIASALSDIPGVRVDVAGVESNLVYFSLEDTHPFVALGGAEHAIHALADKGLMCTGGGQRLRVVLHRDLTEKDLEQAVQILPQVLSA